jgi:hypothetical protein
MSYGSLEWDLDTDLHKAATRRCFVFRLIDNSNTQKNRLISIIKQKIKTFIFSKSINLHNVSMFLVI